MEVESLSEPPWKNIAGSQNDPEHARDAVKKNDGPKKDTVTFQVHRKL